MEKIGTDTDYAAAQLVRGLLVGMPTETVYGLAANAFDADAVLRIFAAKNRPSFDPLIVHTADLDRASEAAAYIPDEARALGARFWPGPLTLILPKGKRIPDVVTSGLPGVAVRVPRHPLASALLGALDFPLAAPSANPFGYISPVTAEHVAAQLGDKVAYILDGGPCEVGIESTIVSFAEKKPRILRLGGLTLEALEAVIGKTETAHTSSSNPAAPGMLSSHYAPRKKLILGDIESLLADHPDSEVAVLGFRHTYGMPGIALSPSGSTTEAAKNLFAAMRELDAAPGELIFAERLPESGLGRAVNDRLSRAAHKN